MASFIPANKCIRTQVLYGDADGHLAENRFYFTYSGSAPTAANLTAVAGSVEATVNSEVMPLVHNSWALNQVTCTDLTSDTSPTGEVIAGGAGALTGARLPGSTCLVVSKTTGRRFRGGHSRVYIPAGDATKLTSDAEWDPTFAAEVQAAWEDSEGAALSGAWSGAGAITFVMASFYSGFTNVAYGTPTKYRRVPTGRATAEFFPVLTYAGKTAVGTQRRRIRP
jgi:hypothetical protein